MQDFRKPRKLIIAAAVFAALPLLINPIVSSAQDDKKANQAAGYIGAMSKDLIASGMRERLEASTDFEGMERDTGEHSADLKTRIQFWHNVALDSVALDHTPVGGGGAPFEQGGPTRTSRALAMVQIAVFEAVNAHDREYDSFTGRQYSGSSINADNASSDAAVARAAYRTLRGFYPAQRDRLTNLFNGDMELIRENEPDNERVENGLNLGNRASLAIRVNRRGDGSSNAEPDFGEGGRVATGTQTFRGTPVNGGTSNIAEWTPDPNTPEGALEFNLSLGAYWGSVRPFFLESGDQFRAPAPPELESNDYAVAFNETAGLGGAPTNQQTVSTGSDALRFIGNFWGYDGVPLVGVPPRVYNQISAQIAGTRLPDPVDYARFLAMINTGMADVAIAAWDSKFYYNLWRPVTGIRSEDGNNATVTDANWNPVGVSILNTEQAVRPTPPFPSYPSGHATFGAFVFETMREFFGDDSAFTFVSDEFNGEGVDPWSPDTPRPFVPVRFESFTQAQLENGRSRIYNGVHWDFDNLEGQQIGLEIAHHMRDHTQAFRPSGSPAEQH